MAEKEQTVRRDRTVGDSSTGRPDRQDSRRRNYGPDRRSSGGRFGRERDRRRRKDEGDLEKRMICIRRVAKVTSGAKRLRFSALVAVGDRKGKVGVGLGRGADPSSAIDKGGKYASTHLAQIELIGDTIPHEIVHKYSAAKVMLKPAGAGTGIIASNAVRSVLEVAGVKNALTKQLGSKDPVANSYCAFEALKLLRNKRILAKKAERANKSKPKIKDGAKKPTKTKK